MEKKRLAYYSLNALLLGGLVTQFAYADSCPRFDDIAKNADARVQFMNHQKAIQYCASQGKRLPSIRELAQLASSMGAAGISETAKEGYFPINAINADGKVDNFYFSYSGYNSPANDLGKHWFWSSSFFSGQSNLACILSGHSGAVFYEELDVEGNVALRCVVDCLTQ